MSNNLEELTKLAIDCAKNPRSIDCLVLHCSDTKPSQQFTLEKLQASHRKQGFGQWPGYHLYIRRDGTLHYCRPVSVIGCHVKGYNTHSIGVCYEGGHKDPLLSPLKGEELAGREESAAVADTSPSKKEAAVADTSLSKKEAVVADTSPSKKEAVVADSSPFKGERGGPYEDNRTPEQKQVLLSVFRLLKAYYPEARILGHCEFGVPKACPCLSPPASVEYAGI